MSSLISMGYHKEGYVFPASYIASTLARQVEFVNPTLNDGVGEITVVFVPSEELAGDHGKGRTLRRNQRKQMQIAPFFIGLWTPSFFTP